MIVWLVGGLIDRLHHCLIGWLVDWLIGWLVGWLVCRWADAHRFIDQSVQGVDDQLCALPVHHGSMALPWQPWAPGDDAGSVQGKMSDVNSCIVYLVFHGEYVHRLSQYKQ